MALPSYTKPGERIFYYFYIFFCGVVFFFLMAPLVAIIPISFSQSPFMLFTEGMLAWPPDPDAWSFRWYRYMVGICLLYTSPSPRDRTRSRMPSSA